MYKTKMVFFVTFNKTFIYSAISINLLVNFQHLWVTPDFEKNWPTYKTTPNLEKMKNSEFEVSALTSEKLSALTLKITVLKS